MLLMFSLTFVTSLYKFGLFSTKKAILRLLTFKKRRIKSRLVFNRANKVSKLRTKSCFFNKKKFKKRRIKKKVRLIRYLSKSVSFMVNSNRINLPTKSTITFKYGVKTWFIQYKMLYLIKKSFIKLTIIFVSSSKPNKIPNTYKVAPYYFSLKTQIFSCLSLFNNFFWSYMLKFLPIRIALNLIKKNIKNKRISLSKFSSLVKENTNSFFYKNLLVYIGLFNIASDEKNKYIVCGNFYNKYILNYLEFFFKTKIYVAIKPYDLYKRSDRKIRRALTSCLFPVLKKFNKLFFYNDFINIMTITFSQRNITIFTRWFIRFMEKIRIKQHKRFLFLLKIYFKRLFAIHSKVLKCVGMRLQIKGKIGSAGNSKKRVFRISNGLCSLNKKNYRISYCNKIIKTYTGALGLKLFLFY